MRGCSRVFHIRPFPEQNGLHSHGTFLAHLLWMEQTKYTHLCVKVLSQHLWNHLHLLYLGGETCWTLLHPEVHHKRDKPHQGAPFIFRCFMQSKLVTGGSRGFAGSKSFHHPSKNNGVKLKKEVACKKKKTVLFVDWIPLFPAMTSLRRSATWWNNFKYATICQRVETRMEHIRTISHFVNELEKH